MNWDITVNDVRIALRQIEVSCIVSSNSVQRVVIFLCIGHLHIIKFYFILYILFYCIYY